MLSGYVSYNDAAGGLDHGYIVVSGYVSTIDKWSGFVAGWQRTLARFNVPYFHMKKFSQSKGPYASWKGDEARRTRFLSTLIDVIGAFVEWGCASIVEFNVFDKVNSRYKLDSAVGIPYSLAGRTCVAKMQDYLRESNGGKLPEVTHVFEDGDEGKGILTLILHRDCGRAPVFKPSRDIKHPKTGDIVRGIVQLQSADFAAYELRKVFKDDPKEEWPIWKYRKSLQALGQIPGYWGRFTESDLVQLCKVGKVPLRTSG
jgi:hypothetical protein